MWSTQSGALWARRNHAGLHARVRCNKCSFTSPQRRLLGGSSDQRRTLWVRAKRSWSISLSADFSSGLAAHQGSAPHTQTSAWHVGTRAAIHRASTAHGRAGHQLHRTPPAATAKVRPGGCRAREGGGSRRRAASSAAAAAGPDLVDWAQGYPYLHGRRLRPLPLRPRQRLQAGLGAGHLPGRRSQR